MSDSASPKAGYEDHNSDFSENWVGNRFGRRPLGEGQPARVV